MTRSNVYLADDKMDSKQRFSLKQICCFQLISVIVFAAGVVGGIFIGIYAYHGGPVNSEGDRSNCDTKALPPPTTVKPDVEKHNRPGECPTVNPVTDRRYEDSIYAPITSLEMNKVASFLLHQGLVSTLELPTDLSQNFILNQAIEPPVKAEALDYLDNGGHRPKRYAKVTVQRGSIATPDVMEYKVGPLDSSSMTAVPLIRPGDIHFNTRPYEYVEAELSLQMLKSELDILAPLIAESFDGARYPDDLFINFFNGPPSTSGTERNTRWVIGFNGFRHTEDSDLTNILPLSGTIHNPGTDTSKWRMEDFHYLNQGPFDNATQLMDAYRTGAIRNIKLDKGYRNTAWDRIFPKRDSSKPFRENADIHGPRTYYPDGPRYTVDATHVKWMDWSFQIGGNQIRGPALFDVKFKNERILYELAVNEIAINYGMDSHGQNNIIYADATYGIMGGATSTNVIKGVDCPEHGTILQTAYWSYWMAQPALNMSAICIFEADGQEALWRHAGQTFEAGVRNRYLTVRVPLVVGNYDYTFEFHFYLDGKIFNYAKASGYIQGSFWDESDPKWSDKTRNPFGYRISDYLMGPVHDHMFGFKVDFDLVDKNNTFQIVKWKAGPQLEAIRTKNATITKAPEYFIYNETRYIEWEKITTELGIQNPNEQQFWLVVNEREKNTWGVERGYQVAPLATGSQSLKQHPLLKALSFTKYHCAVTKRREEEPALTSIYDVNRMDHPQSYLDKYINGENIADEDIVNWVTVGFLHIPTAEDMPMTVRVETGFLLKPFNFFDRTASFDMPQHTETQDKILRESEPAFQQCSEPESEYCRFC